MDDDGGQIEEHARDLVRMRLESVSASHQAVEDGCRIRKGDVLKDSWLCTSGIWCICCPKLRIMNVVMGAISCSVLVFGAKTGHRRMWKSIPKAIDEASCELRRDP